MEEIEVELNLINESPWQPAGRSKRRIEELAASMRALDNGHPRGQLDAGIARPTNGGHDFELIAGHRRLAALKLIGAPTMRLVVRGMSDDEARALFYVSNAQRADLTPLEECDEFAAMHNDLGWSCEEIAARTGKSLGTVRRRLVLAALVPKARTLLEAGTVTLVDAETFAMLDPDVQNKAIAKLEQDAHGEAAQQSQHRRGRLLMFTQLLENAPFDVADERLPGGACARCPKRTNAQILMFGDACSADDFCLDRPCWDAKFEALWQREKDDAIGQGALAFEGEEAKRLWLRGTEIRDPQYTALESRCLEYAGPEAKTYADVFGDEMFLRAVLKADNEVLHLVHTVDLHAELLARGMAKKTPTASNNPKGGRKKKNASDPPPAAPPPIVAIPSRPAGDDDAKIEAGLTQLTRTLATRGPEVHALRMLGTLAIQNLELTRRPCERRGLEPGAWTRDGIAQALRDWLRDQVDSNAVLGLIIELHIDHANEHSAGVTPAGLEAMEKFLGLESGRALEVAHDDDELPFPDVSDEELIDESIFEALKKSPMKRDELIAAISEEFPSEPGSVFAELVEAQVNAAIASDRLVKIKGGKYALQLEIADAPPPAIAHHTAKAIKPGKGRKGRPPIKNLCEIETSELGHAQLMSDGAVGCKECTRRAEKLAKKVKG